MSTLSTKRQIELRLLIENFLSERLKVKLEKLTADDPKRDVLCEQFVPATWLEDASRRVGQIQAVTHSLKPIHSSAKGTNLFCKPSTLASLIEVGTHCLGNEFEMDVVCDAAVLDVYKFLKLQYEGQSLLTLARLADDDFGAALNDDPVVAQTWMTAFAGLVAPRNQFSSHTYAKQIYWLIGDNPHDDASYHLLAPLYPTSLVHRVYQTLQDDRFSDAAKAARQARKADEWHERPVREYPSLAVQKLGGTNPQNISQLNSDRGGNNYLLASLPPLWQAFPVKPLFNVTSLFKIYQRRHEVRKLIKDFYHFLDGNPTANQATRMQRDEFLSALIDELIQFAAGMQTLASGWSKDPRCELPPFHCAWLDPDVNDANVDDVIDEIAKGFANWINDRLRPLPVGDSEFLYWRKLAREQLIEYAGWSA
jgi:CRISPR-associated protein Csy1